MILTESQLEGHIRPLLVSLSSDKRQVEAITRIIVELFVDDRKAHKTEKENINGR